MDVLFQTTGTSGSTELKELLGFIDADIKISKILPDIITSTNDVIDLIGKELYALAVTKYGTGTIADEDKPFIYAVRYPIAVNSYRLLAPSNDLAHTNNGRKMRQDDKEKLPFEWMIDKDNSALEKRYYRALDDLIKFLDNQPDGALKTAWTSSDAFKKTHDLFIRTVSDFDSFFPIQSRLLLIKLAPGILDCEQYEIRPRVSAEKLNTLKTALKSNTAITDAKDLELLRLIRKASVSYSLAWAMPRLSVGLFPDGVLQHVTSDRATIRGEKPTLKSETEAARQAFLSDTEKAFSEIEKLLEPPPAIDACIDVIPKQNFGDGYFSA